MVDDFVMYLDSMVGNSLYVWGGQGESIKTIIKEFVKTKETSNKNVNRAMCLLDKLMPDDIHFYDCSGLGVNWLLKNGLIKSDMTADDLYRMCQSIKKSQIKKGDWVFIGKNGKMTHIGYIVDDKLNVVESAGRSYGVVKRSLSNGSPNGAWTNFGRPIALFPELASKYTFTRVLKLTSPFMHGDDVKVLQREIGAEPDGVFGKDTETKLKARQKQLGLTADGIAGQNTYKALGFNY